jgi:hypothetical protein
MAHRLDSSELKEVLTTTLEEAKKRGKPFEVVQVEGIELAYLMPLVREISPSSRILFDDHNAEAELQRRTFVADRSKPGRWPAAVYSYIQAGRLRKYEAWACSMADWVTAVSQQDKKELETLAPETNISVIPNCTDTLEYAELPEADVPAYDLVFTGKMDYRPNVDAVLWFAEKSWP